LKKLHTQHKKNLDEQKQKLMEEHQKINDAYKDHQEQLEVLKQQKTEAENALRREIDSHKKDAKVFMANSNKENQLRMMQLEQKIEEDEKTIRELGDMVSKLRNEIELLNTKVAEKDKQLKELSESEQARIKQLEKKIAELQHTKFAPKALPSHLPGNSSIVDNQERDDETEQLRTELSQERERSGAEKKDLNKQVEDLKHEIKEKTSQLESVLNKSDKNLADDKLHYLEAELNKARAKCEQLEQDSSKLVKLQEDYDEIHRKYAALKQGTDHKQIETMTREIKEWKVKYEKLETEPKGSSTDQAKLAELEKDVQQWQSKYTHLQTSSTDTNDLKKLQHEIEALKEKLDHKQNEIDMIKKEYQSRDADERVKIMQVHLDKLELELNQKIDLLESTKAQHEKSEDSLNAQIRDYSEKLSENNTRMVQLQAKVQELEKNGSSTANEEVEKYKRLLMKYKSGTQKMKQDAEAVQRLFAEEKEALNLTMKKITDDLFQTNEKLKAANEECNRLRHIISELENGKGALSSLTKDLDEMSKKVKRAMEEKEEATQNLQRTIDTLTEKNKALISEKDKKFQSESSELDKMRINMNKKDQERKEMEQQLHMLLDEKEKIIATLKSKDQNSSTKSSDLEAQVDSLQKNLRKITEKCASETSRAETLEKDILNLNAKMSSAKDDLSSYQTKATEFEALLDKANKQIESLQSKYAELDRVSKLSTQEELSKFEERVKQLRQEYETKIQELEEEKKAEFDRLSIKLSVIEQEKASLEKNLLQVNEKAAALQKEIDALTDQKNKFEPIRKRAIQADELEKDLEESKKAIALEKKRFAELEVQYKESEAMRRKLYNEREDAKGKIRVYARCRPMSSTEKTNGNQHCVDFTDDTTLRIIPKKKDFSFNRVFSDTSTQEEVFQDTSDLIQSSLDGFNVCIFAYGQTGSGKTHTMAGGDTQEMEGLVPRAMRHVFALVNKNKKIFKYTVQCCMLELYMDDLYDLFVKKDKKSIQTKAPDLDIKKDKNGNVVVAGQEMRDTSSYEEMLDVYRNGEKNRHVRSTKMNAVSSRSHLVFSIYISGVNLSTQEKSFGKLTMVDLAGSENRKKTQITEEKGNQEALSINRSLLALGDVISALSEKKTFVPYRNNKLTMLLSDSLGGNAKTLMFVCIGPADYNADESVTSLSYATRVKAITNNVNRQAESKEIQRLKKIIDKLRNASNPNEVDVDEAADISDNVVKEES
jgi:kinesin family protein C2/C3